MKITLIMPVKPIILLLITSPVLLCQALTTALPAQPLGADDLVAVTVANSPELSHQFRVSPDGMLHLPLISAAIPARGRYPQEEEEDVRAALKTQRFFVNPVVSLAVVEYASRPITVMGAVRRPVTFQATAQTTLLDALAKAEGLAPEAGAIVIVTRPKGSGAEQEVTTVPVKMLLGQPDLIGNVRLLGGEQVRVPEAGRIYILGNVRRPCFVPVKDPAEATVLKVLTQAEGLAPFTAGEAVIYRRLEDGTKEIVIDIKSMLKGRTPDMRLEASDVVYVPEARGMRLTVAVLDRLVGFGSTVASGYIVFQR